MIRLSARLLPLALASSAIAASPQPPVKLVAPGFSSFNVAPELTKFLADHFAQQLIHSGLKVTTAEDISTVIGFERQKEMLGCKENSCLTELANALGVDAVVSGSIGKFGTIFQINIKIISAKDAHILSTYSGKVGSDQEALDALSNAARQMASDVFHSQGQSPPSQEVAQDQRSNSSSTTDPSPVSSSSSATSSASIPHDAIAHGPEAVATRPSSDRPWVTYGLVGGGAVVTGLGIALYETAFRFNQDKYAMTFDQATAARSAAAVQSTVGTAAVGVGLVSIATGVALHYLTPNLFRQPLYTPTTGSPEPSSGR